MVKFPEHVRKELLSSPHVTNVTDTHVTFTVEFKKEIVELNLRGVSPIEAFTQLGINVSFFLDKFPKKTVSRWKKIYLEQGVQGLEEKRGKKSTGRPKKVFDPNNIKHLQQKMMELEAENFILKKLNALAANSRKKKGLK